jgi:uncharacterized lipoprotein
MIMQKICFLVCTVALLAACGTSPKERKDKAEAQYYEEKTRIMQEYKDCVDDAGKDQQELTAC